MRLKEPNTFGVWQFFIGEEHEKDSQLLKIPERETVNNKKAIVRLVIATFESLAAQGKPEYKQVALEEAAVMHLSYNDYIAKVIEHQICIRHGGVNGGKCYASGLGDKLHSFAEKIDARVDKAPGFLQKVYEKAVDKSVKIVNRLPSKIKTKVSGGKMIRPKVRRLGGCGSCGGRASFSKQGGNMGRAGRMQ